jgi:hypothetical protein
MLTGILLADAEQGGKGKWDPKPGESEGKLLPFEGESILT